MASLTIQQAFDLALQHHHAGRLLEAEQLYRQILAQQPEHSGAMHCLGVIAYQAGQNDIAVDLIRQAIALNPNTPEAHSNLGLALTAKGQLDEAIAAFRQAITLKPSYRQAHNNLGIALRDNGQLDEAIVACRQAIALEPTYAEAHSNLGIALGEKGQLDEAIAAFNQAIAVEPRFPEAYSNLGVVLSDKGLLDEAIAAHRLALALKPHYPQAHNNLGHALMGQGNFDQAVAAFRQAINLSPSYAEAHSNLGNALRQEGQLDEAVAVCRQAIVLNPLLFEAHSNLGRALRHQGQLDEAIIAYRQAISLSPSYAEAHNNLGNVLKDKGQLDEAIAAYKQAITIRPAYTEAHSNLVYAMYFHPAYDAKAFAEEHRRWTLQYAEPLRKFIQPHTNDPTPDRRLRIGYISPNFRQHTNGLAMLPLLKAHDHTRFEIFCYSDVRHPDAITQQCRSAVDQWRSIVGLTDEQVAEAVRKDQVDIFVDLVSHMGSNRLLAFARKPAPVQVTFLGHQGTTGLTTMDYRISDPYVDPPGPDDAHYTEQIIRLPDCYLVFQSPVDSPEVKEPPASQPGAVTFGSLNNFCKITPQVLQLWSRILTQLPESRLILRCPAGETQQRVLNFFAQRGIDSTRLSLSSQWLGAREYLELHHEIDIYLDTFPHAGHTTSMDALWMGVPLITLKGQTAVGRGGVFLLANLGLEELIAQTEQEYVEKAVELAGDLPRLRALHSTLRQRMERSPLMDATKYARNIESAYRQMWHTWGQSDSARS